MSILTVFNVRHLNICKIELIDERKGGSLYLKKDRVTT